jgi:hypothetical protein
MIAGPSIKGSLFEAVAADVNALVARGRITREELEARLERSDLPYLDEKIGAAFWYPIDTYRRRGAAAANRLIEGGLYRQMDASVDTWGERVGKIMVTLAPLIFNFGKWSCSTEGGELRLEAREAVPLPEVSRVVIEGFVSVMATRAFKSDVQVRSTRPEPDRIVFESRLRV